MPILRKALRGLGTADFPVAGALVGRALRDSPVFLKLMPANPAIRAGALGEIYSVLLRQVAARGKLLGAFEGETLAGVCALAKPRDCQPSGAEKLALGHTIATVTTMGTALAWQRWRAALARRDLDHRHWHLGVLAVEPNEQRRGIGTSLLEEALHAVDSTHEPCFLETDRREAVGFFTRFGFREMMQVTVNETPHWFLLRSPA